MSVAGNGPYPVALQVWPHVEGRENGVLLNALFKTALTDEDINGAVRIAKQIPRAMLRAAMSAIALFSLDVAKELRFRLVHDTRFFEGYRIDCFQALIKEHGFGKADLYYLTQTFSLVERERIENWLS